MYDIINLALPFFGLIALGYACGKFIKQPADGLAWMNFFIIYIALPALFYRLLAKTPLEQLTNIPFVVGTTLSTYIVFALSFAIGFVIMRGKVPEATVAGLAGAYGNIGYMGPGLALATIGPEAAVPIALIFCFDNILLFTLVPLLMAVSRTENPKIGAVLAETAVRIITHPFIIATVLGVASAAFKVELPAGIDRLLAFLQNAAAPCALFVLGVTVALRPVDKMPWEVPALVLVKTVASPVIMLVVLSTIGHFDPVWVYTAVLMAALPTALNVFIIARQYDTWVVQASSSVLVGTLVSVITLTTVMALVKSGALPHDLFP
jgi:hypothetical protein